MEHAKALPLVTEQLCDALASAADALTARQAARIPEQAIEDFIALGWMRWHAGSLELSVLGQMALARIRTRMAAVAA